MRRALVPEVPIRGGLSALSLRRPTLGRRLLQNAGGVLGLALLGTITAVALVSILYVPQNPYRIAVDHAFLPPGLLHPLGTDDLGRDVLSRVMVGARISLGVAGCVLLVAGGLGVPLGILSGYRGRIVDEVVMRATDVFLAFPSFLLAMAIVAALGSSLINAILAVGVAWWPRYTRLMRGQVLGLLHAPYVEAARAAGAGEARILARHLFPNCLAPLLVQMASDAGTAILVTASLSFVGLGAKPPMPEWGFMVAQGRQYLLTAWWIPIAPGVAIGITVAGFMLVGDALRDLLDPKLQRLRV